MTDVAEPNRLSRFLNAPDGITEEQATERARLRLDRIRPSVERDLVETLASLREYLRLLSGAPPAAVRTELRRLTYELAATAGTFERPGLSKVAVALCELFDILDQRNGWDRAAVDVHLDAMRMLLAQPPGEESAELTDGLQRLAVHVERS